MEKLIKVLLVLVCVPLLFLGSKTMFDPTSVIANFGITAEGINGLNTVRGVIGGLLLSTAFMLQMGVFLKETVWLLAAASLMAIVIIGRVAGVVADGFTTQLVGPLVIEFLIIALAWIGHIKIKKGVSHE